MTTREQMQRQSEILRRNVSNDEKVRLLVEIGFGEYEANVVVSEYRPRMNIAPQQRTQQRTQNEVVLTNNYFNDYTFGVEIECDVNRRRFAEYCNSEGVRIECEHYNHTDRRDRFKIVSDASVTGANGCEIVSPVLKGERGFAYLKSVCDRLNNMQAKVNKSCGLHVHIGNTLTEFQRVLLVDIYSACEKHIDAFMAPSRRENKNFFCKSLRTLEADILGNDTFLVDVAGAYENIISHGRYYKVNLTAMLNHGTIEFRQHQGSVDFEKISNWVKFCMCLVHYCEDATIDNFFDKVGSVELSRTVEDLPFLPDELKAYYKQRTEHFANR